MAKLPPMGKIIASQNIARYLAQLKIETDPIKREILQKLRANERRKKSERES